MRLANIPGRIGAVMASVLRPRPSGSIADWASGKTSPDGRPNIYLSSKESGDFAGAYDPQLNPIPTILFDVFQSGLYRKAIFKKSSQSGVTLAVLILICYYVSFITRNFLYVIDSIPEMRRVSQERLQPMLKACRAAASFIPAAEDAMKALTLSLRGCVGYLVGAGSLGALSNKSVGLAVYDEVDAYAPPKEGEETATDLGSERGKKQSTFFEVWLSKPIHWDGPINQEYLTGTRHKCFVPCPHCGTFQELRWKQVRFEHCRTGDSWDFERILRDTWYQCLEGCRIEEHHKPGMIRAREWRPTNVGQDEYKPIPGVFSCEITDLYSTFPTASWGVLAREYVESEGKPSKRAQFWRGRLATASKRKRVKTAVDDVLALRGKYKRGECPVPPDVVVMYCDVQGTEALDGGEAEIGVKKWVKCAFTFHDDAVYVIDYGTILSFDDLLPEADRPVRVLYWPETVAPAARIDPVVYKGLIDEGFRRKEIREWAVSTLLPTRLADGSPDFRFFTAWGQGEVQSRSLKDLVTPQTGAGPNIVVNGLPMFSYRYADDSFKDELYRRRIALAREHARAREDGSAPPKEAALPLHFPEDVGADFLDEFTNETFDYDRKKRRWGWRKRGPNDFPDGVKGCLVQGYIIKPVFQVARARAAA